ncbi:MAG: ATP-grasp domain-containing protein, partial [Deltaproteobacteria bacterium]|nr:ATP-grasp domain-containing protein [Deltaproteobacteria bacterium]
PSAEAMAIGFDKERVRRLGEELGVHSPANILATSPEDLNDPRLDVWIHDAVVVKTTRSKVFRDGQAQEYSARMFTDRDALNREVLALLPSTPVQLQQWVPGRGVGVEVLAYHGELVMTFAHERINEVPLTGGASSYRKSITPPQTLIDDAATLMRALAWHGVAMIEFRVDEASERHWLMEINGRFWGSLPLATYAGADFPRALVEMLLEDRLPQTRDPARVDVYARRFSREIAWFKHSLKHRHDDNPLLLKRSLGPALAEWLRPLAGKETWDGASFHDPLPIAYEVTTALGAEIAIVHRKLRRQALLRLAPHLSRHNLRRAKRRPVRKILTLCYGNICRSPYAAFRLAKLAGDGVHITSAGFHEREGRESPDFIIQGAARRGLDVSAHRSRRVTQDDLDSADLILFMDERNHDLLAQTKKSVLGKSVWLGTFGHSGVEIDDPYDEPERTDELLAQIDDALAGLLNALSTSLTRRSA